MYRVTSIYNDEQTLGTAGDYHRPLALVIQEHPRFTVHRIVQWAPKLRYMYVVYVGRDGDHNI